MTSCFWRDRYRKCAWLSLPLFPQTEAFTERGVPFVSTGQINANRSSSCRNIRGRYGHLSTEAAIVSRGGQASFRPFHTGAGPGGRDRDLPYQKGLTTTSRARIESQLEEIPYRSVNVSIWLLVSHISSKHYLRLVEGIKVKRELDSPLLCSDTLIGIPVDTVVGRLIIPLSI